MPGHKTEKKKDLGYYLITYRDPKEEKILQLKAHTVNDSTLGLSFVSIADFVFDTKSVVVSPQEDYLRKRFENIKRLHVSIYSILSIEEVGEKTNLSFANDKSNLVVLNSKPSLSPKPAPAK
ncbi:MAG: DUF1820 family protein [Pseudomonadota bacterium]|nr:DUF1820 family protein [Pseudomonadota bacterium]